MALRAAALAVLAAVATACPGGSGDPPPSATVPTAPSSASSTTTTAVDVSVIPPVIDEPYLNRVLAALDEVEGRAVRVIVDNKSFVPEAAEILNSIYSDDEFTKKADAWVTAIVEHPETLEVGPNVGTRTTSVERVIASSPSCVWVAVSRAYPVTPAEAAHTQTEFVALQPLDRSNDPKGSNPTAWMIIADVPARRPRAIESVPCVTKTLLLGLLVLGMASPARADPVPPETPATDTRRDIEVSNLPIGTGVRYDVEGGADETSSPGGATQRSRRRAGAARPQVFFGDFPSLVTGPDGRYCIQVVRRPYSEFETAALYEVRQEQRWMELTRQYRLCTGTAPPARSPAAQAAEYWRVLGEKLLPKPDPRIQPGFMLAGQLAYLEARSPLAAHYEHPTPLGVLVLDATSEVWVDWGDGSGVEGPFDDAGAPWPSGRITHFWTETRTYDVRVYQRWTARWHLGAASGDLAGLVTEGLIDDFPVRELQAVLN